MYPIPHYLYAYSSKIWGRDENRLKLWGPNKLECLNAESEEVEETLRYNWHQRGTKKVLQYESRKVTDACIFGSENPFVETKSLKSMPSKAPEVKFALDVETGICLIFDLYFQWCTILIIMDNQAFWSAATELVPCPDGPIAHIFDAIVLKRKLILFYLISSRFSRY